MAYVSVLLSHRRLEAECELQHNPFSAHVRSMCVAI